MFQTQMKRLAQEHLFSIHTHKQMRFVCSIFSSVYVRGHILVFLWISFDNCVSDDYWNSHTCPCGIFLKVLPRWQNLIILKVTTGCSFLEQSTTAIMVLFQVYLLVVVIWLFPHLSNKETKICFVLNQRRLETA